MKNITKAIPQTVGLIMDGNGRWSKKRNRSRLEGHTMGIHNMISLIAHAFECGVKNIICYGLSTENLKRPEEEVKHIYELIIQVFDLFISTFSKIQACVKYVGNTEALPSAIQESIKKTEAALSKYESSGRVIYIAIAYGSWFEITKAVNAAVERGEPVTPKSFLSLLDIPLQPELIIRTGGEQRLSNFLLYQASYSELYFTKKLFPDFSKRDMDKAFKWFQKRNRRFGLI